MTIKIDSWHFRIYTWWLGHTGSGQPAMVSLCPYFNTVFVFAPWALLMDQFRKMFTWLGNRLLSAGDAIDGWLSAFPNRTGDFIAKAILAVAGIVLVGLGLYWGGYLVWIIWQYPIDTLWIVLYGVAAFGALIAGIALFVGAFFGVRALLPKGDKASKPKKARPAPEPLHMPGTLKLIFGWFGAKHRKVCPWLEFE